MKSCKENITDGLAAHVMIKPLRDTWFHHCLSCRFSFSWKGL